MTWGKQPNQRKNLHRWGPSKPSKTKWVTSKPSKTPTRSAWGSVTPSTTSIASEAAVCPEKAARYTENVPTKLPMTDYSKMTKNVTNITEANWDDLLFSKKVFSQVNCIIINIFICSILFLTNQVFLISQLLL